MRKPILTAFLVVLLGLGLLTPGVSATPVFSLESLEDFDAAIVSGNIAPQTSPGPDLEDHYPAPEYEFATPQLYVYDGETSDPDGGLVMSWGNDSDQEYYSQWTYTYTEDPNLVGFTLSALAMAPQGISSISLGIYEASAAGQPSLARSWTWTVGPNQAIPHDTPTWISATIAPAGAGGIGETGALGPVATGFFDNGVDPTKIQILGFDENGNWVRFANPVPGTTPPQFQPWNYWLAVQVTPEPTTLAFFAIATLALLRHKRST